MGLRQDLAEPFERRAFGEEMDEVGGEGRFPPFDPAAAPPQEQKRKPFPILHLDELEIGDDPTWLINGLLPATGFGIVFGPPKNLKSFILADALFHVAMGRPWMERDVLPGAVVYITAEGVEGFKRRLIAMRRHYGVEGQRTPFLLVPATLDLGHQSGDAEGLVEDVRAYLDTIGNPPVRAIAIDTLARNMKGADENTAKDMSTFIDNCGHIASALGCIVIGVHHAGKDTAKGARGSNALDGGVDVMWSVEKGEAATTATIHHMKDGEAGASWQFRLQQAVLREGGATSEFVAAAVVEILAGPGEAQRPATSAGRIKLGDRPKLLLTIIREAIGEMGGGVKGDISIPHDARAVSREDLKRYLPLRGYWDEDKPSNTNRATFSADLKTLKVRGAIGLNSEYVWFGQDQK
ncbi:helicase RepA family protein (plasmid) [Methylobacterium currus]|uniref:AAA family ATPase n=1 Tax=Methylobacterium currus TaxID=2051553 RepID=UPI001E2D27B3|nr:AAA family ATPase [Methylobacterium currus]UHC20480.1 helicase RepA family protein [Methylobacterium currus]